MKLSTRYMGDVLLLLKVVRNNLQKHCLLPILLILMTIIFSYNNLYAESVLNMSPTNADASALYIGAAEVTNDIGVIQGNFGSFAYVDSPSKLYFNLQDMTNERVYMAFSRPCTNRSFESNFVDDVRFRILDPNGNPLTCWGAYNQDGSNGSGWQNIDIKDANVDANGPGYDGIVLGPNVGYTPFIFNPARTFCGDIIAGNYAIEFYQTNHDPQVGFFIENWEVSVYSQGEKVDGRVWSNNWAIGIKRDNPDNIDPDFGRAFNGAFYVCDDGNFITKIDFNSGSPTMGFRGGTFNVFFNSFGPGTGETAFEKRKSIDNDIAQDPNLRYEYKVFLGEPDLAICPPAVLGDYSIVEPLLSRCGATAYCFNLSTNGLGQIEVLIDLNSNGVFDGGAELILMGDVSAENESAEPIDSNFPYEVCIPWNGMDGEGGMINTNTLDIQINFRQGIFHFPVHDIEYNDMGFKVEAIRPCPCNECTGNSCALDLYFDDSNIVEMNSLSSQVEYGGCMSPCHAWASENTPSFGDRNTINTWWYVSFESEMVVVDPQVGYLQSSIDGPDAVCPDEDAFFTVETFSTPNGILIVDSLTYSWTGPNGFTAITKNIGPLNIPGIYTVVITSETTECLHETSRELSIRPDFECCELDVIIPDSDGGTFACFSEFPGIDPSVFTVINSCFNDVQIDTLQTTLIGGGCPADTQRYLITWLIVDSDGNAVTLDETIIFEQVYSFVDTIAPIIESCATIPMPIPCESSTAPEDIGMPIVTDNCPSANLTYDYTDDIIELACVNSVQITRNWVIKDGCGNEATCQQIILTFDNGAPTVNCPADLTLECGMPLPPELNTQDFIFNGTPISDNCSDIFDITSFISQVEGAATPCPLDDVFLNQYIITDDCQVSAFCTQQISYAQSVDTLILLGVPDDLTLSCLGELPAPDTVTAQGDVCLEIYNIVFSEEVVDSTCSNQQTIVRTWTVADNCGQTVSASQTITIFDDLAPLILSCDSIAVSCEASTAPEDLGFPGAIDNCNNANLSFDYTDAIVQLGCVNAIEITRTWIVSDDCGNEASCQQIITTFDDTPPMVTCPADLTLSCGDPLPAEINTLDSIFNGDLIEDNCSDIFEVTSSISQVAGEGTSCPLDDVYLHEYTIADECQTLAFCSQAISYAQDIDAPILVNVPDDLTISCLNELPDTTIVTAEGDACLELGDVIFSEEVIGAECLNQQTIVRAWTVTNNCDQTTSATQTITILDDFAPIITSCDSIVISCEMSTAPEDIGFPVATDNCPNANITYEYTDEVVELGCPNATEITRIWIVRDDCGNEATCQQIITTFDDVAPTVTCPEDLTLSCGASLPSDINIEGTTFNGDPISDNCSDIFQITSTIVQIEGEDTPCPLDDVFLNQYTITDECQVAATCDQTISYFDSLTAPVLVGVPDSYSLSCIDELPDRPVVTAEGDECLELNNIVFTEIRDDIICPDQQVVTRIWTVTDNCGQSASASQTITIFDNDSPVLSETPGDVTVACDAVPVLPDVEANDDCAGFVDVVFEETVANTDCECIYTISRTWIAVDNCGNETVHHQIIEVVDNGDVCSDIDIECPPDITVTEGDPVIWEEPTATTECPETEGCPEPNTHIPGFIYMGEFNNSQYYCSATSDFTWAEANALAQSSGGHLVVINDGAENEYIRSNIMASSTWIGLTDVANEGDFRWVDGSPLNYTNWRSGQPDGSDSYEDFIKIGKSDGKWSDKDPDDRYEFVMEIPCGGTPPVIDCTNISNNIPGFIFMGEFNNSKYYCSATSDFTWTEANALSQNAGGHLVVINDGAENEYIRSNVMASSVWIGLTDAANEGSFRWVDGSPLNYTNWNSGEPSASSADEDYVRMRKDNGEWTDRENSYRYEFVMEIPCGEQEPPVVVDCTNVSDNIPGFTFMGEFNNSKYYCSSTSNFSWTEANALSQNAGGYLVVINDSAENEYIRSNIMASSAWVGLTDAASEGNFQWVDGSPLNYTNWNSGEPSASSAGEDYVRIRKDNGNWTDRENSLRYEFVMEIPCEMVPEPPVPNFTTNGNVDIIQVSGPTNGGTLPPGTYTVEYEATDECGDTTTCVFTVVVEEDNGPCASCTIPTNIALNRPTTQSSVGYVGYPWKANDGNLDGTYQEDSFCETEYTQNPYWEVNLENLACINAINVWNTVDEYDFGYFTRNFYVFTSESPFPSDDLDVLLNDSDIESYYFPGDAGFPTTISTNGTAQYVRVMLEGAGVLGLAEVEIYGCYISQSFTDPDVSANRIDENTGLDFRIKELMVYPNPATNYININMKPYAGRRGTLMIVDNLGRTLYRTEYDEIPRTAVKKELIGYKNGMYAIVLQLEYGKLKTKHFFVENEY